MQILANGEAVRADLRNIPKILRRNDSYPANPQSSIRPAAAHAMTGRYDGPIPPGPRIVADQPRDGGLETSPHCTAPHAIVSAALPCIAQA